IQHTWINNPKFADLYSEADPLLGPIPDDDKATSTEKEIFGKFVEPGKPLRQRVSGLERFVDVRGGAYFFMPGINAIRYLGDLPEPDDSDQ
ncbi:MAG: peroxidase, partial [Thermodesulfobacteriota bacterium]